MFVQRHEKLMSSVLILMEKKKRRGLVIDINTHEQQTLCEFRVLVGMDSSQKV